MTISDWELDRWIAIDRARSLPKWNRETLGRLHIYLNKQYPKAEVCDFCGNVGPTHYALIHGFTYQLKRENFHELCPSCHSAYDKGEIEDIKRAIEECSQR